MTPLIGRLPLHPLGMAAVPALFLFAENQVQQVTLDPLWRPLGLAVLLAAALLLTCAALLWDWLRGALLASLALVLFYSFGHAWNLGGSFLGDRLWLAGVYLLVGVAGAFLIWRRGGSWVPSATGFLNVAVLLLLIFNGARVADFALGSASPVEVRAPSPPPGIDGSGSQPDIYYLIFDRYAGPATLERVYDHDNEPFLAALEERGFAIARDAWANYFKTALSLTSSLSMDYLDPARFPVDAPGFGLVHQALRDHLPVPATLTAIGYEYVHIASYWEPSATNADADIVLRYEDATEFEAAVRATTALSLLEEPRPDDDPETIPFPDLSRGTTLFAFDAVEAAAGRPGPTYVFAHLLVPHPPYVFDADGTLPTAAENVDRSEEEAYAAQLAWTNGRILEMVDRLLDVPPGDEPIIILQGDEGPFPDRYRFIGDGFQWFTASDAEVAQKFGVLNALHLPGIDPAEFGLTDHTSPVNNFRIVMDAYFGAELPPLPDVTYLSRDHARPYELRTYRRLEPSS